MTCLQVVGYPADQLDQALEGVKVVVIPAGVPRKVCSLPRMSMTQHLHDVLLTAWSESSSRVSIPLLNTSLQMTRDDLFNVSSGRRNGCNAT